MAWCTPNVFDSVSLDKVSEFSRGELCPIIRDQLFWQPIMEEEEAQWFIGLLSCGRSHHYHFWPFRVHFHHHQKHVATEWARIIYMDTGPCCVWPCPRVQWCSFRIGLDSLTGCTGFSQILNICVKAGPSKVTACQDLHEGYSSVSLMK